MKLQDRILKEFYDHQDDKYVRYNSKLVNTDKRIIGVPMAVIHEMAEKYKDKYEKIVSLPYDTFEELMLKGLVVARADGTIKEKKKCIYKFLELADNWAVVDGFCSAFVYKQSQRSYFIALCKELAFSDEEFISRAGIELLFLKLHDSVAINMAFKLYDRMTYGQYYKEMAVAWGMATYSYYDESRSLEFFINSDIPIRIKEKAAQKVRDSRRLSDDYKAKITYVVNYEKVWRKKRQEEQGDQEKTEDRKEIRYKI